MSRVCKLLTVILLLVLFVMAGCNRNDTTPIAQESDNRQEQAITEMDTQTTAQSEPEPLSTGWHQASEPWQMPPVTFTGIANRFTFSSGGQRFSPHVLVVSDDGGLWAWGSNASGQLGNGTVTNSYVPIRIMDNVASVEAGSSVSFAITVNGELWEWGDPVGRGYSAFTSHLFIPRKVMDGVVAVSAGGEHYMAIRADGSLWGWGQNWAGQLGDGTTERRNEPVLVMENVISVSAGEISTMAITNDGTLWGFGANGDGQLGDGTRTARYYPVPIMENIVSVVTGAGIRRSYTLAIDADGNLWAWGAMGRTALPGGLDELYPVHIRENIVSVATDTDGRVIALSGEGEIWEWRDNNNVRPINLNDRQRSTLFVGFDIVKVSGNFSTGHIMFLSANGELIGPDINPGTIGTGLIFEGVRMP